MLLFIVPYKVVLTFEHADEILRCDYSMKAHEQSFLLSKAILTLCLWMKSYNVTIQVKAHEQYIIVVLFIMLHKVVLTFVPMDSIEKNTGNLSGK